MQKVVILPFCFLIVSFSFGQKLETTYMDPKDSSLNMYVAVIPEGVPLKAFMFLLPGLGGTAQDVLQQTELSKYAAQKGILTIIPVSKNGVLYFGIGIGVLFRFTAPGGDIRPKTAASPRAPS